MHRKYFMLNLHKSWGRAGLGLIAQSVTCLTADMCMGSCPAQSNTLVEFDHDINFYGHSPPADSRRVVVSYKRKYVHEVLVNRLVKLAQEISVAR